MLAQLSNSTAVPKTLPRGVPHRELLAAVPKRRAG